MIFGHRHDKRKSGLRIIPTHQSSPIPIITMPIPRHLRLRRFRHVPPTFHFAALRSMATIHRGDYATLTEDDVKHFATILASTSILSSLPPFNHPQSDLDSYNNDWMGKYKGHSKLVLKPKSTTEVSAVLKHCYERKLAVVPQGGNTGLVGKWLFYSLKISHVFLGRLRCTRK